MRHKPKDWEKLLKPRLLEYLYHHGPSTIEDMYANCEFEFDPRRLYELRKDGYITWIYHATGSRITVENHYGEQIGVYELTKAGEELVINHLKGRDHD